MLKKLNNANHQYQIILNLVQCSEMTRDPHFLAQQNSAKWHLNIKYPKTRYTASNSILNVLDKCLDYYKLTQ